MKKVKELFEAKIITEKFIKIVKSYQENKIIFDNIQELEEKYREYIKDVNSKETIIYKIKKKMFN